ncbi:expansin (peptidoglycan-binding protein) [Bacillus aerius]|nr:expansin (peptidoglycan-binding protein) [Bacillus aerius]
MYVTDKYPEGSKGALDLSPNAFAKIGNMADGKIPISWKIIKAPISGNVAYRIKEGSSEWWAAIQVRNHKYPVMKMEYYKDGQWVNMEKTDYNHFLGFHMGSTSLPVRITDIRGVIVKDQLPALPSTAASQAYIVKGNVQLPN